MRYRVVDVFTKNPLEGNPLAVFPEAAGLSDKTMQDLAREMNLSETVFFMPATRADCAARIRIFSPNRELDFAGHPTVGSAFVLLDEKLASGENFQIEENVGPIAVKVEPGDDGRPLIWLTTPAIHEGPVYDPSLCAEVLGLAPGDLIGATPQLLSAGNPNIFIALKDKDAVDRASLDSTGLNRLKGDLKSRACVFVFAPVAEGAYSRMFAPDLGIGEDPATGSATGPLAAYMIANRLIDSAPGTRFISEQGTKMRRRSFLHVHIAPEGIQVGGYVTPLVTADLKL